MFKEYVVNVNGNEIPYVRIDNDVNGNPRYIIHFIYFGDTYAEAISKSRKIGGKKYRAKWYGGGIVISSYNLQSDLEFMMEE